VTQIGEGECVTLPIKIMEVPIKISGQNEVIENTIVTGINKEKLNEE